MSNRPINGDAVVSAFADQVRELSIKLAMAEGTIAAQAAQIESLSTPTPEAVS